MNNYNKEFVYFSQSENYVENDVSQNQKEQNERLGSNVKNYDDLLKHFFPDILKAIGNRAIKEETPSLIELEQYLQKHVQTLVDEEIKKNSLKMSNSDAGQKNNIQDQLSQKKNLYLQIKIMILIVIIKMEVPWSEKL